MTRKTTPKNDDAEPLVNIPAPVDPAQRYTIREAMAYLRQSREKTRTDILNDKLKVIRDGSRVYVPGSEIIRRSTLPAA